jgi:hypothetical protein
MKKNHVALILVLTLLGFLIILGGALAKLEHFAHSNYVLLGGIALQFFTAILAVFLVVKHRTKKNQPT